MGIIHCVPLQAELGPSNTPISYNQNNSLITKFTYMIYYTILAQKFTYMIYYCYFIFNTYKQNTYHQTYNSTLQYYICLLDEKNIFRT